MIKITGGHYTPPTLFQFECHRARPRRTAAKRHLVPVVITSLGSRSGTDARGHWQDRASRWAQSPRVTASRFMLSDDADSGASCQATNLLETCSAAPEQAAAWAQMRQPYFVRRFKTADHSRTAENRRSDLWALQQESECPAAVFLNLPAWKSSYPSGLSQGLEMAHLQ